VEIPRPVRACQSVSGQARSRSWVALSGRRGRWGWGSAGGARGYDGIRPSACDRARSVVRPLTPCTRVSAIFQRSSGAKGPYAGGLRRDPALVGLRRSFVGILEGGRGSGVNGGEARLDLIATELPIRGFYRIHGHPAGPPDPGVFPVTIRCGWLWRPPGLRSGRARGPHCPALPSEAGPQTHEM